MKNNLIFQMQTSPAVSVGMSNSGLTQFRKQLVKVGKYVQQATKETYNITAARLAHWVSEFDRWTAEGHKVGIPLGHDRANNPEANRGWVTSLFVEGDSLFGILELSDPNLALTTDVSVATTEDSTDAKGVKYKDLIVHVALTTQPLCTGLSGFKTMSLSLSKEGDISMEFLKTIAKALGIKDVEPTEALILSAVTEQVKPPQEKQELSRVVTDPVVKLVSENRALKLSNLVKAGLITPAIKDVISAKYVEVVALALSMSSKVDDGFDTLYDVLSKNTPVALAEVSGIQSLELANQSANQPNVMQKEVGKRRKAAGLDK